MLLYLNPYCRGESINLGIIVTGNGTNTVKHTATHKLWGKTMEFKGQISLFDGSEKFKINKTIRLITLFSGYDSQALALKYLGVPFEHYKTCEWAVPSIQALKDLHFGEDNTDYSASLSDLEIVDYLDGRISTDYSTPMTRAQIMRKGEKWRRTVFNNMKANRNVGSIVKATADDLHIVDTGKYDYLLTYSFPCFPKNSLVLTDNGYKHICDVSVGDFVLTHTNEYKKVIASRYMGCKETLLIKGMGADKIIATPNHRFYVRTKYREGHKAVRHFHEPIWKQAKDLTKNDYLGIAINKESIIPEWNGIDIEWKDGRKTRHENRLSRLMGVKDEDFEKVRKNQSMSSLYHLAGDSIITNCLMAIFGELLGIDYETKIKETVKEIME